MDSESGMANSNKAPRFNLCDPGRGVDGYRFTCASKADGVTTWPCTGSEHRNLGEIVCSCECHHA